MPSATQQKVLLTELQVLTSELSIEQQTELLAALPPPLRVLFLLDWLDFEIAQGSLVAYFTNSHGRHAEQALEALWEIGATRMAEALSEAIQTSADPPDAARLIELTDRYEDAADQDAWGDKLETYLRRTIAAEAARR